MTTYRDGNNSHLTPHTEYNNETFDGCIKGADLNHCRFSSCSFRKLNARNVDFTCADFSGLAFHNVDLRGAILRGVRNLDQVRGLPGTRFNDDTIVEDIDLEKLSAANSEVASTLRTIRRVGGIKRQRPVFYWFWRLLCDCGRSPAQLAVVGFLSIVSIFGIFYRLGGIYEDNGWLPHLRDTVLRGAALENSEEANLLVANRRAPSFGRCLTFSAMTFLNHSAVGMQWQDTTTDVWVTTELLFGLVCFGVFVSLLAAQLSRNQ